MCIVIDTNVLSSVFSEADANHHQFAPIRKWIYDGDGIVVYGGSKYKREIGGRYRRLFKQLRDRRSAAEIRESMVDLEESKILKKINGNACNDQHVIAIIIVSGCRLVCTQDKNLMKAIKIKSVYPRGRARAHIYSTLKNKDLLNKANIVFLRNTV